MRSSSLTQYLAVTLLWLGMANAGNASIVLIDTVPRPGDPTFEVTGLGDSLGFRDLAAGFSVPGPGTIVGIMTTLEARAYAANPFVIGIASNAMIGQPGPIPHGNAIPPGSLWQANVCTTVAIDGSPRAPCDVVPDRLVPGPIYRLAPGEALDVAVAIVLPQADTYWLYEWFPSQNSSASWIANVAQPTTLFAQRRGVCQRPTDCMDFASRTFVQASQPGAALGLRIEFEPAEIPEPSTVALVGAGALLLWAARRRALVTAS